MTNNYYQTHKEKLQKEASGKCQSSSSEEEKKRQNRPETDIKIPCEVKKEKKRQYHRERNESLLSCFVDF